MPERETINTQAPANATLTPSGDKISAAVNAMLQSLGEPAAHDLAKYIKAECGFEVEKISTLEQLECVEKTLRQVFGTAADLLMQVLHQELGK